MLGAAAGILGLLWLPLGVPFAFAAKLCVRYFTFVARFAGSGALSSVHISSRPIMVWLICTYAAIVIALVMKRRKRAVPFACLFSASLLALCLLYINLRPLPLTMNVLDVGQGACTVFTSRKTAVMVDCGGEEAGERALSHMRNKGLERLDVLILTHLHKDHISGARLLFSQIDVGCVIVPEGDRSIIKDIESSLGDGTELIVALDEVSIDSDELGIKIMSLRMPKNDNDKSLAVLCTADDFSTLITGDMTASGERQLCARYSLPRCDVFIAGHHGDDGSSCEELLEVIRPETAVISCSQDNSYGHPHYETVQRLKKYGAEVLRTDIDGNITLPLERSETNG